MTCFRLHWYLIFFQDPRLSENKQDTDFHRREEFLNVNEKAKFSVLYKSEEYRSCNGWFYFKLFHADRGFRMIWREKRGPINSLDDPTPPTEYQSNFLLILLLCKYNQTRLLSCLTALWIFGEGYIDFWKTYGFMKPREGQHGWTSDHSSQCRSFRRAFNREKAGI